VAARRLIGTTQTGLSPQEVPASAPIFGRPALTELNAVATPLTVAVRCVPDGVGATGDKTRSDYGWRRSLAGTRSVVAGACLNLLDAMLARGRSRIGGPIPAALVARIGRTATLAVG